MNLRLIKWLLSILLLIAFITNGCNKEKSSSIDDSSEKSNLVGEIILIPNPCIEEPCLPSIVYAIEANSENYIISLNHSWIVSDDSIEINKKIFREKDSIKAIGIISTKKDIFFQTFKEIEIDSLSLLSTSFRKNKFLNNSKQDLK